MLTPTHLRLGSRDADVFRTLPCHLRIEHYRHLYRGAADCHTNAAALVRNDVTFGLCADLDILLDGLRNVERSTVPYAVIRLRKTIICTAPSPENRKLKRYKLPKNCP